MGSYVIDDYDFDCIDIGVVGFLIVFIVYKVVLYVWLDLFGDEGVGVDGVGLVVKVLWYD